jgi:hypothetical protein
MLHQLLLLLERGGLLGRRTPLLLLRWKDTWLALPTHLLV